MDSHAKFVRGQFEKPEFPFLKNSKLHHDGYNDERVSTHRVFH